MKTVSIVPSLSRKAGGLFESVRRLHQSLAELPDISVSVLGLEDEFTEADLPAWKPLVVEAFPVVGSRQFGYAPSLKRGLFGKAVEILHTHGIWQYPSVVASTWHTSKGRPYLISPHGMLDPWAVKNSAWKKRLALAFYERRHLEGAACIRALCESEAQAIRAFGLKNRIAIIPNGIDLPVEGPQDDRTTGQRDDKTGGPWSVVGGLKAEGRKVLLYLGRIHPKKGLANLVRAWSAVQKSVVSGQWSEWVLAIAGWDQGGHEAELKKLATELGIVWRDVREFPSPDPAGHPLPSDGRGAGGEGASQLSTINSQPAASLLFLGPQFGADKASCYRNCDAFVLPSLSEGLPMVVLEAWAYGKPVLMTPECNLPEGFAANAAIQIEPSAESVARGLHELFCLPSSDLCSLGQRGRALVADRFTWPKIAQDMRAVYQWVLGGGEKPPCVVDS